eukprot:2912644-Prymnesium_polylepis.1
MEPVRAYRGAIHATTNAYGQMVSFREIDRARFSEVAVGESLTMSLLWSPFDVSIMLCEWGCAHERYRPARAQLRLGRGGPFIGTLHAVAAILPSRAYSDLAGL